VLIAVCVWSTWGIKLYVSGKSKIRAPEGGVEVNK